MSAASRERHERILSEGASLMSQEGLAGVTLGNLAERVGMSKSGLFAHFRSKESVQIELLDYVAILGRRAVQEPAMAAPEGLPRLRAFFQAWLGWAPRAGLPGGCPLAAAAFEVDDLDGPVREHLTELWAEARRFLVDTVRRAIDLNHLRPETDAEQIFWEINGIYLAHHTAQRFMRDPKADLRAHTAFAALLDRFLPESTR